MFCVKFFGTGAGAEIFYLESEPIKSYMEPRKGSAPQHCCTYSFKMYQCSVQYIRYRYISFRTDPLASLDIGMIKPLKKVVKKVCTSAIFYDIVFSFCKTCD